jgi:CheY-like chemotaxis protein
MERKPTVLVCEDEADLLAMYSSALKKHYNVLTASSGRTCIEKYMDLRGPSEEERSTACCSITGLATAWETTLPESYAILATQKRS